MNSQTYALAGQIEQLPFPMTFGRTPPGSRLELDPPGAPRRSTAWSPHLTAGLFDGGNHDFTGKKWWFHQQKLWFNRLTSKNGGVSIKKTMATGS